MCYLRNNGNNLHLNMYAKVVKPHQKLISLNTIEYDLKSFQFMTNIVNYTDVQLKQFKN